MIELITYSYQELHRFVSLAEDAKDFDTAIRLRRLPQALRPVFSTGIVMSGSFSPIQRVLLQKIDDGKVVSLFDPVTQRTVVRDMSLPKEGQPADLDPKRIKYGLDISEAVAHLPEGAAYVREFPDRKRIGDVWRLTPETLTELGNRPKVDKDPFFALNRAISRGEAPPYAQVSHLDAARFYASLGIPVFPIHLNKTPMLRRGLYNGTTDAEQIERWWGAPVGVDREKRKLWSRFDRSGARPPNIGARTGIEGDILDIDGPHAQEVVREHLGLDSMGHFPVVKSGRPDGGFHYWVATTGAGNRAGMFGTENEPSHVDFRGLGGYAAMPPSMHGSRQPYQWHGDRVLGAGPLRLDRLPAGLAEGLVEHDVPDPKATEEARRRIAQLPQAEVGLYIRSAIRNEAERVRTAKSGEANRQLYVSARALHRFVNGGAASGEAVDTALLEAALQRGQTEKEAIDTIDSAARSVAGEARVPPTRAQKPVSAQPSRTSNGASSGRFAEGHGGQSSTSRQSEPSTESRGTPSPSSRGPNSSELLSPYARQVLANHTKFIRGASTTTALEVQLQRSTAGVCKLVNGREMPEEAARTALLGAAVQSVGNRPGLSESRATEIFDRAKLSVAGEEAHPAPRRPSSTQPGPPQVPRVSQAFIA